MKHIMGPNAESTLTNVREKDIQPNAVDLRLDKVLKPISGVPFMITDEIKNHRSTVELQPDLNGMFELIPGMYEIVMENIIQVGENEAGWVITRSTLNRNGVFITSGLYDSGYHGVMAGALHVTTGPLHIKKGTCVGQFLLFNSEALKKYDGSYGLGKEHDKKYV
jgi:deoxycytidine triphosphate deaminase